MPADTTPPYIQRYNRVAALMTIAPSDLREFLELAIALEPDQLREFVAAMSGSSANVAAFGTSLRKLIEGEAVAA